MTGTLYQRSPGSWTLKVSAGPDPLRPGKYRQVTKTVRGNKTQAKAALAELVAEVARGKHTGTSATLGTLLERWLEVIEPDRSPTTIDVYRGYVRRDITPRWGAERITKLEPSELDAWYRALLRGEGRTGAFAGRPLSPRSVRQIHSIIHAALEQGVRWGWLARNPASLASAPGGEQAEHHPPAAPDVHRLIDAMTQRRPDLAVFLRVAAATGARRGEVCALRWRHVDLSNGVVRIERNIIETGPGKSETREQQTKTKSRRKVSVDAETLAILRLWHDRPAAASDGRPPGPSDWVFPRDKDPDQPLRPGTVTQLVRKLRDALGLAGLRTHDLRHFSATQLLAAGVDLKTVSARLGHADAATTLRIYAHALEARDQDAAVKMGRLLARSDATATPAAAPTPAAPTAATPPPT